MTAAVTIKGWCPTLLSPMQSGDGWLARVKPTACTVTAAAARIVADAASRHGNGHIDLTSRANLQLRGLTPRSAELLAEIIIGAGLASANPAVEAVRNVMASPLGPGDATASFDAHASAREFESMLQAEQALHALPPKFAVLVDGGGVLPLAGVAADIMVRAAGSSLAVRLDGGAHVALCSRASLTETVKALVLAFLHLSWEQRQPPRRMAVLVHDLGEEAIFAAAGLTPIPMPDSRTPQARSPVGFIPSPNRAEGSFGVGLPFGRIEGAALAKLADLSKRHGDGSLRTTPWRALLLPGVADADSKDLSDEVTALGLIADPSDRRLRIFACVGAPSCGCASVDARGDASRLAAAIAIDEARTIHVSACAKSCAYRGPAGFTLVGRDGLYDLIREGTTTDTPALTALGIDQIVALLQSGEGQRP